MHSITTSRTPQLRSQSANASTPFLVVAKLRISCARRVEPGRDGTRIHASMPALPMSIPHTRSRYSGSSLTSSTTLTSPSSRRTMGSVPPGDPRANGRI